MKFKKLLAIGSSLLLVAGFVSLGAGPASAGGEDNTNGTAYWEAVYPDSDCYKDSGTYGAVTDSGMTVTLAGSYDWVALIVKGGAVDYGDGPGNKVYNNPSSGTPYSPPLNNGGKQAAVSHWIVCWSTTPPTPQDATASATPTDAACDAPGGVDFGIANATWDDRSDVTDGSRTATAVQGHLFANGESTTTVTYTIAPQLTGEQCAPPTIVHPTMTVTQECGVATVVFTNGTPYAFAGDVRVDNEAASHVDYYGLGDFYQIVNIPKNGSITKTYTFAEDSGDHTVAARIGLGAESDWYVPWQSVTVTSDCQPPVMLTQCDVVADGGVSTNLAPNGWTTSGDVEWVNGGIKLSVPGDWATASISRVFNQTIEHVGSAIGFTASPRQYVGIHLRTSEGSITFEPVYGGVGWWSEADFGVGAGMGYASFASLADYVAQNPDLVVNSIDVLYTHPEASSTVLTDVTFGCAKYTFDFQPVVVETVPVVTFSDMCGVANDAIIGGTDTASIDYTITADSRVAGVGLVTVTAAPQPGHVFAEGAYTGPWSQEFTNESCGEFEIAYIAPSAFDPTCPGVEAGASGYIQLDLKANLHYAIDGVSATQAKNELAPGTYTISVTADSGFTLSGPASWDMTINPPFCPPTLALLSTTASMQNITCSAAGSYTLADTEGIQWLVNGVLTPAGTHTAADATTVNVEAQLVDDVNDGWEEGAQKTWTFDFTNPADCLPTLAFTGANGGNLGLLLAGGLLLFGGTIIAFERRLRITRK